MRWKDASFFEFERKSMETETIKWSEFPIGGKAAVEQIPESEEKINPQEEDSESHCQGFE